MQDVNTSSEDFVRYSQRVMRLVAEDTLAEVPSEPVTVTTPCGTFDGIQPIPAATSICAVSIVRSGDCLLEAVRQVEPASAVGKILIQRDETTVDKVPRLFYCKLPTTISDMYVILCDPMLATGGSAKMALDVLVQQHQVDPRRILFANVISAPEGLRVLAHAYPQVRIVTAWVDQGLNADKFIVPGLGDYGDRYFNTMS